MRSNGANSGTALDYIFKVPRKLAFSKLYRYYFDFVLRLLYRVILFENIPETIEETFLKLILYTTGKISFFEGNKIDEPEKQLLALNCSRSDTPNVYYMPSKCLVTNPKLKKSYTLTPGVDCEIIYLSEADKYMISDIQGGLYALIERTAVMLADNDISINIGQKNTRLVNLLAADTQNTVDSIRAVISSMYEGDPTIITKKSLIDKLEGIPILQTQTNNNLIELIEVQQYILAHFFEQIGICTHDNMKKERLITAEINDNLDLSLLNIDDILASISEGLERVNAMFGTNITCKLNPIIERQRQRADAEAALLGAEDLEPEEDAAEDPEPEEETIETAAAIDDDGANVPGEQTGEKEEAADDISEPEEDAPEDPEPEPGDAPAEDAAEDPESDAEAAEDAEQPIENNDITLDISGDNNIIIIGGGESNDGSTSEDSSENMGSDNEDGVQ